MSTLSGYEVVVMQGFLQSRTLLIPLIISFKSVVSEGLTHAYTHGQGLGPFFSFAYYKLQEPLGYRQCT